MKMHTAVKTALFILGVELLAGGGVLLWHSPTFWAVLLLIVALANVLLVGCAIWIDLNEID